MDLATRSPQTLGAAVAVPYGTRSEERRTNHWYAIVPIAAGLMGRVRLRGSS